MRRHRWIFLTSTWLLLLAGLYATSPSLGEPGAGAAVAPEPGPPPHGRLVVGTSGDYAPFSLARDGRLEGFDLKIARAYARERGFELRIVRFRWPELLEGLVAGRFDVAMSGITVRPERSAAGVFTVPVMETGAVVLVPEDAPVRSPDALDAPGVRIAVNAGGHLERVARARFPRAQVLALSPNEAVPEALRDGAADAVVSDSAEAPHWMREGPALRRLGPLSRDLKAYLLPAHRAGLAKDLDAWLLAREADGTLERLRREALGEEGSPRTAEPLPALLAALDERLDLMPLVAEAKRASRVAVRDDAQEERILAAALAASRAAAASLGMPAPPDDAVRALFQVQIAAARAVQAAVLAEAPAGTQGDVPSDLATLRAALARIGERIAMLAVRLPDHLEPAAVREAAHRGLTAPGLDAAARERIADAVVALARAPRKPRAGAAEPTL
jgi:cyclohexadienyl dehydratase